MKVVSENETKYYNTSPRRNGYNHAKGTFANSDRERCGADDDRGPPWEPRLVEYARRCNKGPQRRTTVRYRSRTNSDRSERSESKKSDSDNRSNQSTQSRGSNQSHRRERNRRHSPVQVRGNREDSAGRRERIEIHCQVMKSIAEMPTQCIKPSDHPFIGQLHPRLPIRSLKENCSHAEQYRRWVNDMPCRSTERSDEISRWIDHFEASKVVPMHTVNLDVDSLEVTRWWRYFLVEIGILDRRDRVFRDFT